MPPPTTTPCRSRSSGTTGRRIVEFALRAPSVHNTQPWRWRIDGLRLDLYADRARQLEVADPEGRNLLVSCGAALHYAVAAAAAQGWAARTDLLPDPGDPDHLADVRLSPRPASRPDTAHAELLAARSTDRRRFITWPVRPRLLEALAATARHGRAAVVPITGNAARQRVELLISRAMSIERADPRFVAEQRRWTRRTGEARLDGVPPDAPPPASGRLQGRWPSRFDDDADDDPAGAPKGNTSSDMGGDEPGTIATPTDGLLVIVTRDDDPASWLDAGDALCLLWTAAMERGLSVIPLSQVVEVAETREALRYGVLDAERRPALVLRVGWQGLSRSPLPATPRRTVDEVLLRPVAPSEPR